MFYKILADIINTEILKTEKNSENIEEKLRVNVEWERGAIMTLEEILAGESKNVEFKENLPEKSIKYMKSVVAFANETENLLLENGM